MKVHQTAKGRIVAICDRELIGRVLEEDDVVIDLERYKSFYVGEMAGADDVKNALKGFSSANIVGRKASAIILELGLAEKDDLSYVESVPYIQIYRI